MESLLQLECPSRPSLRYFTADHNRRGAMSFREAVAALEVRFVEGYQRGDAAASVGGYAEDAVYLTNGKPPARGRKAIEALVDEDIASGLRVFGLTPFHMESAGDLGYVLETCRTSAGDVTTMLILRRDESAAWRIAAEAVVETTPAA
jgi:ketosteroid isomerase-like protein